MLLIKMINQKSHWENVFATKQEKEVSWYQDSPKTSISFLQKLSIDKSAKIIDVGGGDSYFIDSLLNLGYTNLTLLDISSKAIERIKNRLGDRANNITFIVSDILEFQPDVTYDFWHDRASFHFLTEENQIKKYAKIVSNSISKDGKLVLGTFSKKGPLKCSGLDITQYDEHNLYEIFNDNFELIECFTEDHKTPFDTIQNFIFASFNKK